MCFICSQSEGFETDISTVIGLAQHSKLIVNNAVSNENLSKNNLTNPQKSTSFQPIDPKYLIMGYADGRDEIAIRKEYAGSNKQIKVYLSDGGDELIDINLGGSEHKKYYSLKPENWQKSYVINSLEKINEFIDVDLKLVNTLDEADYTIVISPLADNNFLSADAERGKSGNVLSVSYQAGLYTTETNLDLLNHTDFSRKMQKATFVHELGHLLGLEHPFDLIDDDVLDPYYPENFSYLRTEQLFPYEFTLMGWNGSYVDDTSYENIWFRDIDIKSLEVIWSKSNVKSFSAKSYDYKFYNLGNGNYGIKGESSENIDALTGIDLLKFNDQNLNLINDIKATFDQVTGLNTDSGKMFRLYNASFKRLPDPDGLRYWINNFSSGKDDERAVASSFLVSEEFKQRYGEDVSNAKYVETLYVNVLGRDYDQEGYNYWLGNLNAGIETRYELLLGFAESAENKTLFSEMTGFV